MRKVYVSLSVAALGGIGALLLSGRGREVIRWVADHISHGPDKLLEWNEAAQRELDRIQISLNRVSESLGRMASGS